MSYGRIFVVGAGRIELLGYHPTFSDGFTDRCQEQPPLSCFVWQRVRDSNPRGAFAPHFLAGRHLKPARSTLYIYWRKWRDSNSRAPCGTHCFRDRTNKPLWHTSKFNVCLKIDPLRSKKCCHTLHVERDRRLELLTSTMARLRSTN